MLVTLADIKSYLGIPSGDTSQDSFLQLQLELISEAVEGYCNRKFSQRTYTQTFYRRDFDKAPNAIRLFHYPLVSIGTIVEKKDASDPGVGVSDYRFHLPSAKLDKNWGSFFANGETLEVTYVAGFATLPTVIKSVVYGLVQERYNKKMNGIDLNFGTDVQRISIPGAIAIDFDYSLNNNERKNAFGQILGSYVNVLDAYRSERSVVGDVRSAYVV